MTSSNKSLGLSEHDNTLETSNKNLGLSEHDNTLETSNKNLGLSEHDNTLETRGPLREKRALAPCLAPSNESLRPNKLAIPPAQWKDVDIDLGSKFANGNILVTLMDLNINVLLRQGADNDKNRDIIDVLTISPSILYKN